VTLRERDGAPFRTDAGNLIYDCALGAIADAAALAFRPDASPGVNEHGLFIGLSKTLIVAHREFVEVLEKP